MPLILIQKILLQFAISVQRLSVDFASVSFCNVLIGPRGRTTVIGYDLLCTCAIAKPRPWRLIRLVVMPCT